MTARATCGTCRFWDREQPHHVYGDCRRLPPLNTLSAYGRQGLGQRIEVTITTDRSAAWPNCSQDDWCGEHQPNPEGPPAP